MLHETETIYRELCEPLTDKESRFVEEYLVDCNAAKAARKAGYSGRSAKEIGYENLTKPHLAAAIRAGLDMIAARCEVSAEKVMRELASIGFSNISYFEIDDEGYLTLTEGAPAEAIKAIQNVKRKRIVKDDGTVIYETEYRLWDKIQALTLLGKKLKLWVERIETENPQDEVYRHLLKQLKEGEQK